VKKYKGKELEWVSYPLGGLGAGMLCMEGSGSIGSVSVRNSPDLPNEPFMYSALTIKGKEPITKVLEAPVPNRKIFAFEGEKAHGTTRQAYGLPRFRNGEFTAQFPFANIHLKDDKMPVDVNIEAWSPFIPGDEDASGMPFAAMEFTFENKTDESVDAVYYYVSENFMMLNKDYETLPLENGFVFTQNGSNEKPSDEGMFAVSVDQDAVVDTMWCFGKSRFYDTRLVLWKEVAEGVLTGRRPEKGENSDSKGATIAVPFSLNAHEKKTITLRFSWFVPYSNTNFGTDEGSFVDGGGADLGVDPSVKISYSPWYTTVLKDIYDADKKWKSEYAILKERTAKFTESFQSMDLPEKLCEAVEANLSILKSPSFLRLENGRIWGWEGCYDSLGCCHGSCTHVYNYAQALCHLFPNLERTLRQTEFYESQDERGHQVYRSALPIREIGHPFEAAADGQLGGIMKVYRDWKISGEHEWLQGIWDKVKRSMDFCIERWDPQHNGVLLEPHHNTYDTELWGADGFCTSIYLGALKAFSEMGQYLGENVESYEQLFKKGNAYIDKELFNGEYFIQKVEWKNLREKQDLSNKSEYEKHILESEGPRFQYGTGCLADAVVGDWMARACGTQSILNEENVRKTLCSIYKYNFRKDLTEHANPERGNYALNEEGGLLLCTWPNGGKFTVPFPYCDEVWTGIEYQVASHLMMLGEVDKGLDIVKAVRDRYAGMVRNPFDEYECGHFYIRALASYSLIQGYTGVRYDAISKTLFANTKNTKNYTAFLSTATGYGTVRMNNGEVSVHPVEGMIDVQHIVVH